MRDASPPQMRLRLTSCGSPGDLLLPLPRPAVPLRCKPWRWVGHLLGHESHGSVAYALKQAGLIQVRVPEFVARVYSRGKV